MSHKSGHIIINFTLPHDEDGTEDAEAPTRREPAVAISLGDACSEVECVEAARRAYRKLVRRGDDA
jgi:hypothetical protein